MWAFHLRCLSISTSRKRQVWEEGRKALLSRATLQAWPCDRAERQLVWILKFLANVPSTALGGKRTPYFVGTVGALRRFLWISGLYHQCIGWPWCWGNGYSSGGEGGRLYTLWRIEGNYWTCEVFMNLYWTYWISVSSHNFHPGLYLSWDRKCLQRMGISW